jgi:DNA polymerase V
MNNENFEILLYKKGENLKLPLMLATVPAGFPSPADEYIDEKIDLNEFLIEHPLATFFVRVKGNSMIGVGIHSGDVLIVDKAIEARNNHIVMAVMDGEFTVKRLRKINNKLFLEPENPEFKSIELNENCDFQIWGVVTYVIHNPYTQ